MKVFTLLSIVSLCSTKPLLQDEVSPLMVKYDIPAIPTAHHPIFTCPLECTCHIRVVQCSDAGLRSVPAQIPRSTVMLDLQNNKISEIKENDFKNLPSLYALFLINNQIHKMHPKAFKSIKHLKLLYLSWNLMPQVPTNLPKSLVELRIDDNKIKKVQKDVFNGMKHLHVLELSGNPLDTPGIEPEAFNGVPQLFYIRISQAKLSSVPKNLPSNLYELYLDSNKISMVELEDFRRYKHLYRLDLGYNQIKEVENGSLAYLSNVRQIHLENNKLKRVPPGLNELKYLQVVYLHNNNISSVDVNDFCPRGSGIKRAFYNGISLFGNPVKYWEIQPASFRCVSSAYGLHLGNFKK
ncbi:asporin (LRR class 1) precursor [Callorhinchus milii]|uniref:Asporin n=2 Tax=Callorhinchus milii TaxID=7868 RepID=V9NEH9_CALMI|nr:asporin precursor [Callorhinchus milii]AGN91180.1 asporin [Callorhinchus milii]